MSSPSISLSSTSRTMGSSVVMTFFICRGLMGGRGLGQFDPESAAVAGDGHHARPSAHSLRSFLYDGEPDTRAGVRGGVQALKYLKNSLLKFCRDSDPIVFHPNSNDSAQPFLRPEPYLRRFGCNKFQRIAEQIHEHLP